MLCTPIVQTRARACVCVCGGDGGRGLQAAHNHIPYEFRKQKSGLWITTESKWEIRKRKS